MLGLTRDECADRYPKLLMRRIGGQRVMDILWDKHIERMSNDALCVKYGLRLRTLQSRVKAAHDALIEEGAFPEAWIQTSRAGRRALPSRLTLAGAA